jgi:hypothetical protein
MFDSDIYRLLCRRQANYHFSAGCFARGPRQEVFRKHLSMAELIRSRLQSISRAKRQPGRDPLARVEGLIQNGRLSQGIGGALYGE